MVAVWGTPLARVWDGGKEEGYSRGIKELSTNSSEHTGLDQ